MEQTIPIPADVFSRRIVPEVQSRLEQVLKKIDPASRFGKFVMLIKGLDEISNRIAPVLGAALATGEKRRQNSMVSTLYEAQRNLDDSIVQFEGVLDVLSDESMGADFRAQFERSLETSENLAPTVQAGPSQTQESTGHLTAPTSHLASSLGDSPAGASS